MTSIIDQFPQSVRLNNLSLIASDDLPLDGLTKVRDRAIELRKSLSSLTRPQAIGSLEIGPMPGVLSKGAIAQTLDGLLSKLRQVDIASLLGDCAHGVLPVSPSNLKDFGITTLNSTIGQITGIVLPSPHITAPAIVVDGLGVDMATFDAAMRRLARAGTDVPAKTLLMLLKLAQSMVETVSDVGAMKGLIVQSVKEIYSQEVRNLQYRLPYCVIDSVTGTFRGAQGQDFLKKYSDMLSQIEGLSAANSDQIGEVIASGEVIAGRLRELAQAQKTLEDFAKNDTSALQAALANVTTPADASRVYLQDYYDSFQTGAVDVLHRLGKPVKDLGSMADGVTRFLEDGVSKARDAAGGVASQITSNLARVNDFLKAIEDKIEEIRQQIAAFVDQVKAKANSAAGYAKQGCAVIGKQVDQFFAKVEDLKIQLDTQVRAFTATAEDKLKIAFDRLEAEIKELLDEIFDVLNRKEVQDALERARLGIEKFKTTIEQASLKPVFDLVISKAGGLETSIKALDVANMSTPQRVALKAAAKFLEKVDVDQAVKPELMAEFRDIQEPLQALIQLLEAKALQIADRIDQFNPGTVMVGLLEKPYKSLIDLLDQLRPSNLLQPLREANKGLADIVRTLDPQLLIDQAQQVYTNLAGVLEVLNPAPLNRKVGDAVDFATAQLTTLRDSGMDSLLTAAKQTISIENLLSGTGLQEIAHAELWDLLQRIFGGDYLDQIKDGLAAAGESLAEPCPTITDFSEPLALVHTLSDSVYKEKNATATMFRDAAKKLTDVMAVCGPDIQQLEARRVSLLHRNNSFPEIDRLLDSLDLAPVVFLAAWHPPKVTKSPLDDIAATFTKDVLHSLDTISYEDLNKAVLGIYQTQISDPIGAVLDNIKNALRPFQEAAVKFQGIFSTVAAMPKRIDDIVGPFLDGVSDDIKEIISSTISLLQGFRDQFKATLNNIFAAVKDIVDRFSPIWLLNSFYEADFTGASRDGNPPAGMVSMAKRIVSGSDDGGLTIAALLHTKLTADQLKLMDSELAQSNLIPGSRENVCFALNQVLQDATLAANAEPLRLSLSLRASELCAIRGRTPEQSKELYRCEALTAQLLDANADYRGGVNSAALVRINRVILEAAYRDDIEMSLPSLHPFVVANVARLYPEESVLTLDGLHATLKNYLLEAPNRMVAGPLDIEFKKIKAILKANFDIKGVFDVLEIKLDGLDEDFSAGLDRLSLVYKHLLATLDTRLSGAY